MLRLRPIVACTLGTLLFAGCAVTPSGKLDIRPVSEVRHSGTESAATWYQVGKHHQQAGRLGEAMEAYRRALGLEGRHLEARNALAVAYSQLGKYGLAEVALREAIGQHPGAAHLYNNLGLVLNEQGRYEAAAVELRNALLLDPASTRAKNNLEMTLAARARQQDSLATLDTQPAAPQSVAIASPEVISEPVAPVAAAAPRVSAAPPQETVAPAPAVTAPPARVPAVVAAPVIATPLEPVAIAKPLIVAPPATIATAPAMQVQQEEQKGRLVRLAENVYELRAAPAPVAAPVVAAVEQKTAETAAASAYGLEISNGNGITGMARRVSEFLAQKGITPVRLTNQKPFRQAYTEIQYRPGYLYQASRLGRAITVRPSMVENAGLRSGTDVRLVLGRDEATNIAMLAQLEGETRLARR